LEEFRGLAWAPVQSKLLDYENAQILLVGHGEDTSHAKNVQSSDSQKNQKDVEDIDELAEDDLQRISNLSGKYKSPVRSDITAYIIQGTMPYFMIWT
jgi:hypothetical protein